MYVSIIICVLLYVCYSPPPMQDVSQTTDLAAMTIPDAQRYARDFFTPMRKHPLGGCMGEDRLTPWVGGLAWGAWVRADSPPGWV